MTKPKAELSLATEKESPGTVAETALASESSLKKDWLRPGESRAWNYL